MPSGLSATNTFSAWFMFALRHRALPLALMAAGLTIIWIAGHAIAGSIPGAFTHVVFLDVGQGDAMFIETPGGRRVVIDGGPDGRIVRSLSRRLPQFDQRVDVLYLTHPDADHLRGALAVLRDLKVTSVFMTGASNMTAGFGEFLKTLEAKRVPAYQLLTGEAIDLGSGATLNVLSPLLSVAGLDLPKTNNTGAVARLTFGERSFLFTADVEAPIERLLVARGLGMSDVLKVPHHGSLTSSSPEFLTAVSPGLAVIEVGRNNSYGHPRPETLQKLAPSKIFRTDQNGDIDMWTDGRSIWVKSAR